MATSDGPSSGDAFLKLLRRLMPEYNTDGVDLPRMLAPYLAEQLLPSHDRMADRVERDVRSSWIVRLCFPERTTSLQEMYEHFHALYERNAAGKAVLSEIGEFLRSGQGHWKPRNDERYKVRLGHYQRFVDELKEYRTALRPIHESISEQTSAELLFLGSERLGRIVGVSRSGRAALRSKLPDAERRRMAVGALDVVIEDAEEMHERFRRDRAAGNVADMPGAFINAWMTEGARSRFMIEIDAQIELNQHVENVLREVWNDLYRVHEDREATTRMRTIMKQTPDVLRAILLGNSTKEVSEAEVEVVRKQMRVTGLDVDGDLLGISDDDFLKVVDRAHRKEFGLVTLPIIDLDATTTGVERNVSE